MNVENPNGNGEHKQCRENRFSNPTAYCTELGNVLGRMSFSGVEKIVSVLYDAYADGKTFYLFGNGGSAALAQHFACDLGKGTIVPGNRRIRAVSLADNMPLLTAWANDSAYEDVFAEQLLNVVRPGDIAFAISGSGNSPNVLKALQVARKHGATTIGIGGFQGGKMLALCDICVVVPSDFMQLIEDVHLALAHAVSVALRARIADSSRAMAAASAGIE